MAAVVVRAGSYAHTMYLAEVSVFKNYPKKTVPPLGGGGGEIPPKIICRQ